MKPRNVAILLFCSLAPLQPAAGDDVFFQFRIENIAGEPVDTNTLPQIYDALDGSRLMTAERIVCAAGNCRVTVRSGGGVPIKTDENGNPAQMVIVRVSAPGYEDTWLGPYKWAQTDDYEYVVNRPGAASPPVMRAVVTKKTAEWRPEFVPWKDLPSRFDKLKEKLAAAPRTFVRVKSGVKDLGKLIDGQYDCPGNGVETDEQFMRSKCALLNVYLSLQDSGAWLEYLQQIHEFDEERIIGEVDPKMYAEVERLLEEQPAFHCGSAHRANTVLHNFKDPVLPGSLEDPPVSIKLPVCQGNLQLSVAGIKVDGKIHYVADIDIDEHFAEPLHLIDVGKHYASKRGTNAYDMGEMLLSLHRAQPGSDGFMLGYKLVPKGQARTTCSVRGGIRGKD